MPRAPKLELLEKCVHDINERGAKVEEKAKAIAKQLIDPKKDNIGTGASKLDALQFPIRFTEDYVLPHELNMLLNACADVGYANCLVVWTTRGQRSWTASAYRKADAEFLRKRRELESISKGKSIHEGERIYATRAKYPLARDWTDSIS